MGDKESSKLNKQILNNFLVKRRPLVCQGKVHVINKLVRVVKKLRDKIEKTESDKVKEKFNRKADRLLEEVFFLKHVKPDDVMKFGLLNKKTFKEVGYDPKSKIEARAMCRLVEHKSISTAVTDFRKQYTNWEKEVPILLKSLGIGNRAKKLKRVKVSGKLQKYLEKEAQSLKLLQELTDIDIDPQILKSANQNLKKVEKEGTNGRNLKRKREKDLKASSKVDNKRTKKEGNKQIASQENDRESRDSLIEVNKSEGNGAFCENEIGKEIAGGNGTSEEEEEEEEVLVEHTKKESSDDMYITAEGNIDKLNDSKNTGIKFKTDCSSKDKDGTSGVVVTVLEQEHKMQMKKSDDNENDENYSNSDSEDGPEESNSDGEEEIGRSDFGSQSSEGVGQKESFKEELDVVNPVRKKKISKVELNKSNHNLLNKVHGLSKTSELKQVDLSCVSGTIESSNDRVVSDSEDDDFFLGKTKPKKTKRANKSGFFLGAGGNDSESEDDESEESEEDEDERHYDPDDGGTIDSSRYFKRNLFRKNDDHVGNDRGRGRGQSGDEGRGRGRGRGDQGFGRGGTEGDRFGQRLNRSQRRAAERQAGGWKSDSGNPNLMPLSKKSDDPASPVTGDSFGSSNKEDSKNSVSDRSSSFGRGRGSGFGRGRGDGFGRGRGGGFGRGRGGSFGRGRGGDQQGKWGARGSFSSSDYGSANHIPLPKKEDGDLPLVKAEKLEGTEHTDSDKNFPTRGRGSDRSGGGRGGYHWKEQRGGRGETQGDDQEGGQGRDRGRGRGSGRGGRGGDRGSRGSHRGSHFTNRDDSSAKGAVTSRPLENLHPSWQAKMREKEKSASINMFQGTRVVFDED